MYLPLKSPEQLLECLISLEKGKKKVSPLKERNISGHIHHEAFKICGSERTVSITSQLHPNSASFDTPLGGKDTCIQPELNPSAVPYQLCDLELVIDLP